MCSAATQWMQLQRLCWNATKGQEIITGQVKKKEFWAAGAVTYTISFATRSTLWTRQTSVSLLSLLTGGSDQANQPWVTLRDEDQYVNTNTETVAQAQQQQPPVGSFK